LKCEFRFKKSVAYFFGALPINYKTIQDFNENVNYAYVSPKK